MNKVNSEILKLIDIFFSHARRSGQDLVKDPVFLRSFKGTQTTLAELLANLDFDPNNFFQDEPELAIILIELRDEVVAALKSLDPIQNNGRWLEQVAKVQANAIALLSMLGCCDLPAE